MNKFALLLVLVLLVALIVMAVPAFSQGGAPAATGGASMAPPDPGAGGPSSRGPGGGMGGGPKANGKPASAHGKAPGPDVAKAAPKIGLILGIIAVIAIGGVFLMKKKNA